MELFKHSLFINLKHRTDRLEHVTNEFKKMGINAERIEGIQPKSGAVGCTMSHIKCLEIAKSRNYEQVFICEDDITFTSPEKFKEQITKFNENKDINWDVLVVSGNVTASGYWGSGANLTGIVLPASGTDLNLNNLNVGVKTSTTALAVNAIASISSFLIFAFFIAASTTGIMFFWCALDANSGTTPP